MNSTGLLLCGLKENGPSRPKRPTAGPLARPKGRRDSRGAGLQPKRPRGAARGRSERGGSGAAARARRRGRNGDSGDGQGGTGRTARGGAAQVSTLIIAVNFECEKCCKKIQKVLRKLKEKENIRNISFDTQKNTVTISGPFDDPEKLSQKLRCRAGEAIEDIKVQEKKSEDKKPEDKKSEGKSNPKEETKAAASASTTVNMQFTHMCNICYPGPCSDPTHWGVHPQNPQWPCTHGWPAMPPPPMCCPGPSSCRGCNGCRIVQERKFVYEEYPPSACAVM